jgi:hypothetical protein
LLFGKRLARIMYRSLQLLKNSRAGVWQAKRLFATGKGRPKQPGSTRPWVKNSEIAPFYTERILFRAFSDVQVQVIVLGVL